MTSYAGLRECVCLFSVLVLRTWVRITCFSDGLENSYDMVVVDYVIAQYYSFGVGKIGRRL